MRINPDNRSQSVFALQKALVAKHGGPAPKPSFISHIKRRFIKRVVE